MKHYLYLKILVAESKFHVIKDEQNSRGTDQSNRLLQSQSFGLYNRTIVITNDVIQS